MKSMHLLSKNEDGFVLITAMVMLVILTLIGTFALNTTQFELQIAGNDRVAKQTFYQADGGTELAERLIFENAVCYNSGGFTKNESNPPSRNINKVRVHRLNLLDNLVGPDGTLSITPPSDSDRDATYYIDTLGDEATPHTNFKVAGQIHPTPGSGMQMVSGYEGLGSGTAAGGAHALFAMYSQHKGVLGSESVVATEWQLSLHLINYASSYDCKY